jgi:Na+-translocating ferredoxin:NAD+ oxidoreductase RNF subunit RnfB
MISELRKDDQTVLILWVSQIRCNDRIGCTDLALFSHVSNSTADCHRTVENSHLNKMDFMHTNFQDLKFTSFCSLCTNTKPLEAASVIGKEYHLSFRPPILQ